MINILWKISLLLLSFWFGTAEIALCAEQRFLFSDAVKTALQNNHDIRALKNSALAVRQNIGVARSYLLPKLGFEERFMRTVNPGYAFMMKLNQQRIEQQDFNPDKLNNPDPINDFQTSLFVEQPVFTRKGFLGLEISKADSLAKDEESERKQEEIIFHVVRAVISLDTAKAFVGVAQKSVEEAKEHLRITEVRLKSGLGQYSDTLRAGTSVSEAEQRKVSAEKNLRVAKRGLGLLLGMEEDVDILDTIPDIPVQALDNYTKAALSRRDVKSSEIKEENARKNIKMAEAGYFPYVGVGGGYQLNDHNRPLGGEGNSWQVSAFLRWDLFDGTKREYERAKAKYEAASAGEQLSSLKKNVSFQIYEAYLSIDEARKNVELARSALASGEEGKRLVRLRFENGLYPLVDLLSAQVSLDRARANLTVREGEYRLSVARLSYESGLIRKDLKIEP
ncbi:MAG: TolC family protein [Syntrophales bacterium]|nr:TolC family protein [Syntrophales bacterium]